jgi:DUF4097 and DUF4098 domain-containing protein YvlB
MRTPRHVVGLLATLALVGCFLSVTDLDRDLDAVAAEPFAEQVDASADVRLQLNGINGSVTIHGDATTTVARVSGVRSVRSDSRSDAEQFLGRVSVEVQQEAGEISVRTSQPASADGREVTVNYDLIVPSYLEVEVVNVNGEIDVRSIDGGVGVTSANGAVTLVDIVTDLEVTLTNGGIMSEVTLLPGGLVDLSVVNGDVVLEVPASTSATLEADVVNGSVSVTGLTLLNATASTRSVHGRLGAGDGSIDLDVVNGTITVRGP